MKVPIAPQVRTLLAPCCVALLLATSTARAADGVFTPVSSDEAQTVAVNWLTAQLAAGESAPDVAGVSPFFSPDSASHIGWVVDIAPRGYVLLPVFRELSPIYGYSLQSDLPVLGTAPATVWFRSNLASSLKRLEHVRNDAKARESFVANRALWAHWLSYGTRAEVQGLPVLNFAYRESLLNDRVYSGMDPTGEDTPPDYPGDYQKPLAWHSGHPYNSKSPIVRTVPEEVWVDVDATGTFTMGEFVSDLRAYDADGGWETPSDPPEPGQQTSLYFFDDDDNGEYSYTAVNDQLYITAGGEWIWRDENGDGFYTYGIDQPVHPALREANQDLWLARNNQIGIHGNLYYTSTIGDGRYTYTEAHARPGSYVAALGMLTRYWEWPDVGLGTHSYDWAYHEAGEDEELYVQLTADYEHAYNWARMPLNGLSLESAAEQANVAQLLYDLGVAFEVDFQIDTPLIEVSQTTVERFAHHFRYNRQAIHHLQRVNTAGDDAWFAEIAEEIDAKRPVIIQAFSDETFISPIIDGYLKGTGYTDDANVSAANANMYLVHCNLSGTAHWWALDNIKGIPYGDGSDAQGALIDQMGTFGIVPQRVPQTVLCEAFVEEGAAGTAEFHQALTQMQNLKGRRFLTLVYHPDTADPYYLGDHDPSQDTLAARMTAYGLDAATTYPLALLNGRADDPVGGQANALADQLDLYAAYQRRTTEDSRYRIVGDSVVGVTPQENRPVCKADIYVTRLDEDTPESETLTLTTVLAENVNNGAHWTVREFLDMRDVEFGYGLTRIANITQLPELPEATWDLDDARIIVLLQRADGTVIQAARLQHFAPGPNYQIVDGLGLYRATLTNRPPHAPTEVVLTQSPDAGDTHLHAEVLGAYDPDGDAIRYEYRWYKNGILQPDLYDVTADSSATITDANVTADSLWYCEVRVFDEYYAQGNLIDTPGDPGTVNDPVEKETNHVSGTVLSNPLLIANGQAPQNNQAPDAPAFVEISPGNASVQDSLTCLTDGPSDPDGDAVNLIYKWYKDGALQANYTDPSLPYGTVAAGERWTCEVTAQDMWGATSAAVTSTEITIAEARANPPTVPLYVSVGPDEPSYISTLTCGRPIGITSDSGEPNDDDGDDDDDDDGDDYEVHFRWWRMDGQSWRPTQHTGVIGPDDDWVCQVPMSQADMGTLWRCEIFARNTVTGANGPAYTTESLLVRNKVPDNPTAHVTPQFAKLDEKLNCFASGGADAEDVENTRYYFEWLVNGEPSRIAGYGQDTVDASFTSSGETWTCRVYAEDTLGGRSATITASGEIFIGSPPTAPEKAVVSPRRPESDEMVVCTASGAIDPDGQPITYQYTWFVEKKQTSTGQLPPASPEALPENRQYWYWEEAYSGSTLLASVTEYGQRYACLVTATDGDFTSSGISSPKIIIGNQPPSKPTIAVTPSHPRPGESMTCEILNESTDVEGDEFSYVFEWFRTDSDAVQYLGATLPPGRTDLGETWYCQVTVTDIPPGGIPPASNTVQSDEFPFVSVPPTAPTDVTITPTAPKAEEDLTCAASGSVDPNGDAITYEFTWLRNSGAGWENTLFDDPVLDAANTVDGDRWRCVVLARDSNGLASDSVAASAVTIGNQAPTQPGTPVITPDPAGIEEDLVCAADGSADPNGDQITYEFQWYRHRPTVEDEPQPVVGATAPSVAKSLLQYGDTWYCRVRATDGAAFSDWVTSQSVTIANLAPSPPLSVSLTPQAPTSIQDILCSASGSTDPEGGAVYYTYTWKRNGELTQFSTQILAAENTGIGEQWNCEVRAVDNDGNLSEPTTPGTVTVVAPNPSAPTVSVVPAEPTRYDELTCEAADSVDPGGQEIAYTYIWSYREEGAALSDWQTPDPDIAGSTVSRSNLENGQSWRCAVYAENESGFRSATVTGNEVVVLNRPPTAPASVLLSLVRAEHNAVCAMSGSNDFEQFWYDVVWQRYENGAWTAVNTTLEVTPGDTAALPSIAFDDSFYRCSVTARDAEGAVSEASLSNVVKAAAGLPEKPDIQVSANGRRLTCTATISTPATRSAVFIWFRNGFRTSYSAADKDGTDGFENTIVVPPSDVDETWSCRVYAVDNQTKAQSEPATAELAAATYINNAPGEPTAALIPAEPRTGNDLAVEIQTEAIDPDDDDVVYHYNWYRNGELEKEHVGPVIAAADTTTGDTWQCRIIARDRYNGQTTITAMTAPLLTMDAADAEPDTQPETYTEAYEFTPRVAPVRVVDSDGDTDWLSFTLDTTTETSITVQGLTGQATYAVDLYDEAGVPATPLDSSPGASDPTEIAAQTLDPGTYHLRVQGTWGQAYEDPTNYPTYQTTVHLGTVKINAPNGLDQYEDDDTWELAKALQSGSGQSHNFGAQHDPDWMVFEVTREADIAIDWTIIQGDPILSVSVYSAAGVPDTPIKTVTTSPLTLAGLDSGTYYVKVDGTWRVNHDSIRTYPVYSLTLDLTPVVIDNRAPTAPTSVVVRPSAPIPGDPLRCVPQGARDADGDSLDYHYYWYQNGSLRPALSGRNAATLPPAATILGDSWACRVRVTDPAGERSDFAQSDTVTLGNAADWTVSIDVAPALRSSLAKNPDAVAALTSPLTFGQMADATDGWDDGIDDAAPPANATVDVPYVAFDGTPRMQTDIRAIESARKLWTLKVDLTSAQEESITLSWSLDDLPARGVLQMRDTTTGALVNMRDVQQMTIDDAGDTGNGQVHEIAVAYDASYLNRVLLTPDDAAGWHLLSLILEGPFENPADVFGQVTIGSVWQYNSETGQYQSASELQVGQAYWLYFPEAVQLEHLGYPALDDTLRLLAGWNLVGVTLTTALPTHPDIDPAQIWFWDANAATPTYGNPKVLEAGVSYWIYATDDVTVPLE